MGLLGGVGLMPICAVCEVRLEGYFFCRKKVRIFVCSFSSMARLFRRRILSSPQSIFGICGDLVRFLAPCASLAFIVVASHYDGAEALLAGVDAAAAQFVVAAPSGAWIQVQTPLPFCFPG